MISKDPADVSPYDRGRNAYRDGLRFYENPYDPVKEAVEYTNWENGYWMASVKDVEDEE